MWLISALWLTWIALFSAGVTLSVRGWRKLKEMRFANRLLELKRRYDTGEITREEYEKTINEVLKKAA